MPQTAAGPIGRDTRFRRESRLLGRPLAMATEITAYEHLRRLTTSARTTLRLLKPQPVLDVQGTTICDPLRGGTRVPRTLEAQPRGILTSLMPPVARALSQRLDMVFATLTRLLEAPQLSRPFAQSIRRMLQEPSTYYADECRGGDHHEGDCSAHVRLTGRSHAPGG